MAKNLIPEFLEESVYKHSYLTKLEFPFGNFYVFPTFIVAEIAEGEHFNWTKAKEMIDAVYEYFGTQDIELSYISNRVNSYSVQPKDWLEFYRGRHKLNRLAFVVYNERSLLNILLEGMFTKHKINKFYSLHEAIGWVKSFEIKPT